MDFTELSGDGVAFELMVREICISLGYHARWSGGPGPDGGKDLLVDEPGRKIFGNKSRRWLVSCKHFANARGGRGRAVGVGDLAASGSIVDGCRQHRADGFLLVCSTTPSPATVERLESIGSKGSPHTHVWDGFILERVLQSPRQWAIAQRFLPLSAERSRWKVWGTEQPNHFIAAARGLYLHLYNRHGSDLEYQLDSIDIRLDAIEALPLPDGHELRLRAMWCDDKHGAFRWYVDYLHDCDRPAHSEEELASALGHGRANDDGQFDSWDIKIYRVNRHSDSWHANHYRFYRSYIGAFSSGGDRRYLR